MHTHARRSICSVRPGTTTGGLQATKKLRGQEAQVASRPDLEGQKGNALLLACIQCRAQVIRRAAECTLAHSVKPIKTAVLCIMTTVLALAPVIQAVGTSMSIAACLVPLVRLRLAVVVRERCC